MKGGARVLAVLLGLTMLAGLAVVLAPVVRPIRLHAGRLSVIAGAGPAPYFAPKAELLMLDPLKQNSGIWAFGVGSWEYKVWWSYRPS